jgi:hypothetical protein
MAELIAMLLRDGDISVHTRTEGAGHMHWMTRDCTTETGSGCVDIVSQVSFVSDCDRKVRSVVFGVYRREATAIMVQNRRGQLW